MSLNMMSSLCVDLESRISSLEECSHVLAKVVSVRGTLCCGQRAELHHRIPHTLSSTRSVGRETEQLSECG